MHELADNLRGIVTRAGAQLSALLDIESAPMPDGSWSPKEVIGHLIDSAANNHQRFVRLGLAPGLESPGYEQAEWVKLQRYANRPWSELLALWTAYNLHLAHVMESIPRESLANEGTVKGNPITLEFLMTDYVKHLQHHLRSLGVIVPASAKP
jgi:hypothetical protein